MSTGSFPGVKSGRGVLLNPHSFQRRGLGRVELCHNRDCNGVTLPSLGGIRIWRNMYFFFLELLQSQEKICKSVRHKFKCTFLHCYTIRRSGSESRIDLQGFAFLHFSCKLEVVHQSLCFHYNIQSGRGDYPSCCSAWLTGLSVRVADIPEFLRQHGAYTIFRLKYSPFPTRRDRTQFWFQASLRLWSSNVRIADIICLRNKLVIQILFLLEQR
jgi:hypothetical protein